MKKICACLFVALTGLFAISLLVFAQAPDERSSGRAGAPREYPKPEASAVRSMSGKWKVSDDWATLPTGVSWGVTSAATSDANGRIYVLRRTEVPILAFDKGTVVKQFGKGLFKWPHGIRVDNEGYLWAIDGEDNVIYKMAPRQNHEVILTIGRRGLIGDNTSRDSFNRPADVAFALNGDFFIADGYGNSRVVKFSKDGRFIGTWGSKGTEAGQFNLPHAIVIDSRSRVIVADRTNKRVQVFDVNGKFIEMWTTLGAPYGLAIAKDDTLYVSDADAGTLSVSKGGKVVDLIENLGRPHEITLDPSGDVYMADVRAERVRRIFRQ